MFTNEWFSASKKDTSRRARGNRWERRLRLEPLEQRRLLSAIQWTGDHNDDWSEDRNWQGLSVPSDTDTALFKQADRDPRLTVDTSVGAINADTGSETEINLNGHNLEMKLAEGIVVSDSTEGAGGTPAKLSIINSGTATKTVTTSQVAVGLHGDTFLGYPHQAEMSITGSKVSLNSSGHLFVGGRNQGTMELEYGSVTCGPVSLGGGADLPPESGDLTIAELTVANNATFTANENVVIGNANGTGSAANSSKLISTMNINAGAELSVGSLKDVQVGKYHRGELIVTGGGKLIGQGMGAEVIVGNATDLPGDGKEWLGKGLLSVDGSGSKVEARYLGVGHAVTMNASFARGEVEITNGGLVEVGQDAQVGYIAGGTGTDQVTGNKITVAGTSDVLKGVLDIEGNFTVGRNGEVIVENFGEINVTGNFHLQRKKPQVFLGVVTIKTGGKMTVEGAATNEGKFQVETDGEMKTLSQGFTNKGFVLIGSSAGKFQLDGDFEQTPPGVLEIELGGYTPGTQYDVLEVDDFDSDGWGGDVTLGGTLQVSCLPGFYPQLSDEFSVVTAPAGSGSLDGEFDYVDVTQAPLGSGLAWALEYDRTDADEDGLYEVILRVVQENDADIEINRFYTESEHGIDWLKGRIRNSR